MALQVMVADAVAVAVAVVALLSRLLVEPPLN